MSDTKASHAKEKRDAVQRLLLDEFVLLHVDPSQDGVALPPHLSEQPTVTLKLSHQFAGALLVEPSHISAELLFKGNYFTCVIPYEALWGLTSAKGENLIWPFSVPDGVLQKLAASAAALQQPPREEAPAEPAPAQTSLSDNAPSDKDKHADLTRPAATPVDREALKRRFKRVK